MNNEAAFFRYRRSNQRGTAVEMLESLARLRRHPYFARASGASHVRLDGAAKGAAIAYPQDVAPERKCEPAMRSVIVTCSLTSLIVIAASACSSPEGGTADGPPSFGGPPGFQGNPADGELPPAGASNTGMTGGSTSNSNGSATGSGNNEAPGQVPLSNGQMTAGNNAGPTPGSTDPSAPPNAGDTDTVDPAAPGDGEPQPPAPVGQEPALPVDPPAGPYFTSGQWSGFVAVETEVAGTTVTPAASGALPDSTPFCLDGSVAPSADYSGAARLVFNLNQPQTPSSGQSFAPQTTVPRGTGLAFTFTRSTGAMLRVQLESPDGTAWCHSIPEVRGQTFVPYTAFNTECWTDTTGRNYGFEPVHSVVFSVPGSNFTRTGYDFCVAGLADANGVGQAPPAPAGFLTGDITGSLQEVSERAVVLGPNGKKYIVQNNAWGATSSNGSQLINYANNSFTIQHQRAPQNGNVPVSFPSIFIGGNGYTGGDQSLSTRIDDNLPIRVSDIDSIPTRFAHNATSGDYNATYDVWFSAQPPQGEYQTATGAFLMVWTYKPGNRNAIGRVVANNVNVGGQTWQLVAGRRGEGGDANAADANSPVISYIRQGTALTDYSFDLNDFIQDAVARAANNQLNGLQFSPNLFLTDIFAGFEIWNGGDNLRINAFTAEVR